MGKGRRGAASVEIGLVAPAVLAMAFASAPPYATESQGSDGPAAGLTESVGGLESVGAESGSASAQTFAEYAPQVTELDDGTLVQRTPTEGLVFTTLDSSYTYNMPEQTVPYNTYYLKADKRGCNACHDDLAETLNDMAYDHVDLSNGYGIQITVQMCIDCHTFGYGYMTNQNSFGSLIHGIHSEGQADCRNCHKATGSGDGMQLWDETKHHQLRGITPVPDVQGEFSFGQSLTASANDLFDFDWQYYALDYLRHDNTESSAALDKGTFDEWTVTDKARRDIVEPHRSPERTDGRPRLGRGRRVAGLATIHRAADEDRTDAPGATGNRRVRRHLRRKGRTARGGREETCGGTKVPHTISGRPAEAGERSRLGDREDDTVVGPGTARPVGIVDRASRLLVGGKAAAHAAEAVGEVEVACLGGRPPETVTPDGGKGSADHEEVSRRLGGARFYFCEPRHPWQKPTVENADGLIRELFPKGTDFSEVTDEEVQRVNGLINDRRRRVLGHRIANEVYREMLHSA